MGERIAKVIARAGVASRREAERLIDEGRVAVDGKTLETPAFLIEGNERIEIDGEVLPMAPPAELWCFHKPKGVMVTKNDPEGRETIYHLLPPDMQHLQPVGRLDYNSEGLLLLTNHGGLKRYLELPTTGWKRKYRVRVRSYKIDEKKLNSLKDGITVDGIRYKGIIATLDKQQGANAWLSITLTEGKNKEIRRIMDHLEYPVSRLLRTSYGTFTLGDLKEGTYKQVPGKSLKAQLPEGLI